MDRAFIQARITATKLAIVAYEDALLAFATSNTQSYTLNTGQTQQSVTRADIGKINNIIASLENRCATLEARLNGGTTMVTPAW